MISLVFSIAVHENNDCVLDLLDNILFFNPTSKIVLHVAHAFDFSLPKKYVNVFVNPISLRTGFMDATLAYVHLSNAKYILKQKITCSIFVPFGSNQMFVKQGFEQYCFKEKSVKFPQYYNQTLNMSDSVQTPRFINDNLFNDYHFKSGVIKSAPEGTFYEFNLIVKLLEHIEEKPLFKFRFDFMYSTYSGLIIRKGVRNIVRVLYKLNLPFPKFLSAYSYAAEEVLFPSLSTCSNEVDDISCFSPWDKGLVVNIQDVENIRNTVNDYYSVKRVNRVYEDPLRVFIRSLIKTNH